VKIRSTTDRSTKKKNEKAEKEKKKEGERERERLARVIEDLQKK
jgi:hypothetical protein